MKRPLAVIGFTVLFALIFAGAAGFAASAAVAVFMLLCAAAMLLVIKPFKYRRVLAAALFSASFACLWYSLAWHLWYEPALALDGAQVKLSGTVWDEPQSSDGRYVYFIRTDRFVGNGKTIPLKTTVRLRSAEPLGLNAFDKVELQATLSLPASGEGGFDTRAYYRSKGVYLFAQPVYTRQTEGGEISADSITVATPAGKPLYSYAVSLREYISSVIGRYVTGEEGALCAGILIGDTSFLPQQVKDDFTVCGISHILAVSGTQTSLICQFLLLALAACGLRKRPRALLAMAAVFLFMAVTGFSPSVMRAGIMSILYLAAMIVGRESDALNSLGFSVLVLCLANPFAATDTGLLLSFAATLGMITVSGRIAALIARLGRQLPAPVRRCIDPPAQVLSQTLGASIFTYPVILLTFRQISTVALLTNLIEVPVSLFVTLAAAVMVMLAPLRVFGFLISPISMLIRLAAALMMWVAQIFAAIPFASVSTDYGFVYILLAFTAAVSLLYILFRHRGGDAALAAVCVCFAFSVGLLSCLIASRGVMQIASLPVAYGSCTVVSRDGRAIAVDLSGSSSCYQLEQYLKAHNITHLDALILSGYDKERVDSSNTLMADVRVDNVIVPGAYYTGRGYAAKYVSARSELKLWSDVLIQVTPSSDRKKLLTIIRYGASSVLLTGGEDFSRSEYGLPADSLKTDTIAFGGGVSSELIKTLSPKYALAGDSASCAYAAAMLQSSGCRVQPVMGGVHSILTRGNGQYSLSQAGID